MPSGAPPADKLVERVRQTGCLQVLLGTEGVCMDSEINSPTSNPQDRNMLMQTIVLINILIKCIVYPVLRPRKAQQPQRGSNSMGQDDSPAVEAADDAPR